MTPFHRDATVPSLAIFARGCDPDEIRRGHGRDATRGRGDAERHRAVPGAGEHRVRRDGRRLQGLRPPHQADAGHQDDPPGHPAAEPSVQVLHRAVLPRGPDLGNPLAPEHRHPVRHRGRGRPPLPGDGVRRGGDDRLHPRARPALQAREGHRTRQPGRLRRRLRAHQGRHPSRHQALEPDPVRHGPGQGHGLRYRQARGRGDDAVGDAARDPVLHVARAGDGGQARRAQRHLLPRRLRVRDVVRRAAVPRQQRDVDPVQARPRRSDRARQPRDERARPREVARGVRARAGQEARRSLPDRDRIRAGPRVLPGRVVRGHRRVRGHGRSRARPRSLRGLEVGGGGHGLPARRHRPRHPQDESAGDASARGPPARRASRTSGRPAAEDESACARPRSRAAEDYACSGPPHRSSHREPQHGDDSYAGRARAGARLRGGSSDGLPEGPGSRPATPNRAGGSRAGGSGRGDGADAQPRPEHRRTSRPRPDAGARVRGAFDDRDAQLRDGNASAAADRRAPASAGRRGRWSPRPRPCRPCGSLAARC